MLVVKRTNVLVIYYYFFCAITSGIMESFKV